MGHKLITQIILIVVALVIIFAFIKPAFLETEKTQDELFQYKEAVEKAGQLNQQLQTLVRSELSFSQNERLALRKFLPSTIDDLSVMKDIQRILALSNITPDTLFSSEMQSEGTLATDEYDNDGNLLPPIDEVYYQEFTVTFISSYYDMKNALKMLETNAYILEVANLKVSPAPVEETENVQGDPDRMATELTLRVYQLGSVIN